MDFFKSVFSDEPDLSDITNSPNSNPISESPKPPIEHQHPNQEQPTLQDPDPNPNPNPNPNPKSQSSDELEGGSGSVWSFGGLIKTFATKSETVIQTYRRDLEEFGTGLKKETEAIREAAGRVVKELPSSIEVAQGSIESVWRGTTDIIVQSKESILADLEGDSTSNSPQQIVNSSKKYSRFDAQVLAIQGDSSAYTEEPEDVEDYRKWKLGFGVEELEEKGEEMESLLTENAAMDGIYAKLVPSVVDHETFWSRYFYRVFKLKQVEDARANLVKRAISGEDEDLSWDVDDDENSVVELKGSSKKEEEEETESPEAAEAVIEKKEPEVVGAGIESKTSSVVESVLDDKNVSLDKLKEVSEVKSEEAMNESDEKAMPAANSDKPDKGAGAGAGAGAGVGVSGETSQVTVPEEEDLGWDEIEDLGSDDEKKVVSGGSPRKSDLRKRLSVAKEEEEDLNWDIEDDDEPVKK